ncbi:MAG: HU family DNA-binding protein [Moraxella sp.]|nr:HU family DNA-binding protein [Moraxella sp.]
MNKSELIDAIAEQSGLTKADSTKALNAFIESVTDAMKRNDDVVLVGFGTFSVRERAARTGRNPKTKEAIQIPASKAVGFKAGKGLKDAVNAPAPKAKKGKK